MYISSSLRRYALSLLSGVSYLNYTKSRIMDRCKLISKCYATVIKQGVLQHDPPANEHILGLTLFISDICWVVVIWTVKYSILAFYWRLFSVNRPLTRLFIWALTALVMCWGIAVVRPHSPILKPIKEFRCRNL